ncbi:MULTISPECIES: TIGR03826 family flagellar region protein [Bacillaceae]|uniref:TIGR03826 family flagellar region protein n=1 Tax=Bacillaceae TaxID=186817 RepID=UPI001F1D422E|nr:MULTISPECIES: TIGR03826 family flagellar region protein [Bacillaceae]MCF2649519.1 hypothetical protein [Niallia circulans]CAI9385727.1 hypothetical protein BACSP_00118 [Bacillus sp. T2.9-1]
MAELGNCPQCGDIYVLNNIRDVCLNCYKQEEADFEKVYQFIRKKQNRTAQMEEVVEATGVEKTLIYKFIKKGRIKLAQFPNLGYPCAKCGTIIREGKLCQPCMTGIQSDLHVIEKEEERKKELEKRNTYFTR